MGTLVVSQSGADKTCLQLSEHFGNRLGQQRHMTASFVNYEKVLLQVQPQIVAVVLAGNPERGLEIVRHLRRLISGTILAVGPATESRLILRTLQEGAEHYLDETDLGSGVNTVLTRKQDKEESRVLKGRVLSILACSGGCGASTLAVNLAALLGKSKTGCALFDLKAGRGDLAPLLDIRPAFTLVDLCQNTSRLDRTMFEKMLARHSSGIRLLAAPPMFGDSRRVTPAGVDQALRLACRLFSSVVIDLEDCYHEEQMLALEQVSTLFLVCRLDFTSLRNARRIQEHLSGKGIPRTKIQVIINRFGQPGELPVDEAEDALGTKLIHFIPDDPKTINLANNVGVPVVVKSPASKVAQSIGQLATWFQEQSKPGPEHALKNAACGLA